ncbi:SCF E3 ubiquitin ligase complex F-box protein GRR1 [Hanseniaspora opuntiae]|uniref:SCF E3 ubiquitin ligase complex F-box protein GRR1 n=1 Tax=Hanseniaspora opuntiae TaxID=211096 RepID=A0A1E5R6C7_9ASCO|nr:SCF E3 ubiquitin ligase complex F-box protein GRR1 [Hanseniaspora opuntiae]
MIRIEIYDNCYLNQLETITEFVEEIYTSQASETNLQANITSEEYNDFNEALYNLVDECFYGHTSVLSKSHDINDKKNKKDLFLFKYMKAHQFFDYNFRFNTVDSSWKDKFNLIYKILSTNLKKHSYYLVVLIYLINNNYLDNLIVKKNMLFNDFFLESPLVEVMKLLFIVLQLKDDKNNLGGLWHNFCYDLINKILIHGPNYNVLAEDDINFSFYTEVFIKKEVYLNKMFVQVIINEYLQLLSSIKSASNNLSSSKLYEASREIVNTIQGKTVPTLLPQIIHTQIHFSKKYTYNWIIQSRLGKENIICPSEYTKVIQSHHINKININCVDSADDTSVQVASINTSVESKSNKNMKSYPEHIMRRILAKLNNSELLKMITVNKTFAKIISELIYYRPYISSKNKMRKFEASIFYSLAQATIFPYHKLVKRLNFSFFNVTIEPGSLRVLGACSSVERLTMIRLNGITGNDISIFVKNLKKNILTSVDVTNTPLLNGDEVGAFIENCELSLQGLYMPNSQCNTELLNKLFEKCRNLKRVRIMETSFLTNDNLITMSLNLHKIVELDISECQNINSYAVYKALSGMPNIRDFVANGCKNIDNSFIRNLYENKVFLKKLKNFSVGNLNPIFSLQDTDLYYLTVIAPNIKHLTLSKHSDITDVGMGYISKLKKSLTTLNIGHLSQISNLGISYIIECSKLTYLDLSACDSISSEGFILLSNFKRLRRLGMVKCMKLDDYTLLKFLAKTNAQLERVHLSYCPQLTGFSILELLRRHPKLQHLSVSGIPAVQSLLPKLRDYSRQAPYEFTSEQTISFAIFSGSKNIAHIKDVLIKQLVDRRFTDKFTEDNALRNLFEAYLNYRNCEDSNYKGLLVHVLVPFFNTCFAYDFITNKYSVDAIYQEETAISSELDAIFNYVSTRAFFDSKKVFDFLSGTETVGDIDYTLPITNLNCSLKDFKLLPNYLTKQIDSKEAEKVKHKQNLYRKSDLKKLFRENNDWIYYIMEYLECWQNNLFCYLSIRDQRSSFQQFKKIDVSMKHLKVLYRNLNMLKDNSLHYDFILYANQVSPIVASIASKFEQLVFVTLVKEFLTLESTIEKFELIDKLSIVEALTRDLRKAILDFRVAEYGTLSSQISSNWYFYQLREIIKLPSKFYDKQILHDFRHDSNMIFPGFRFDRKRP